MSGLWIAHINVHDEALYGEYIKGATATVEAHGGSFMARGARHQQMEGDEFSRNVVVKFPSFEVAVEAYESDLYQSVLPHALGASVRTFVIVEADD